MRTFFVLLLAFSTVRGHSQIRTELSVSNPYSRYSMTNISYADSGLNTPYHASLFIGGSLLFKNVPGYFGIGYRRGALAFVTVHRALFTDGSEYSIKQTLYPAMNCFTLFQDFILTKNKRLSIRTSYEPYFTRKNFNSGFIGINVSYDVIKHKRFSLQTGAGVRYDTSTHPNDIVRSTLNNRNYIFYLKRDPLSFQANINCSWQIPKNRD